MKKTCDNHGCGDLAKWQACLRLYAIGKPKVKSMSAEVITPICLCDKHKAEVKVDAFLSRPQKETLASAFTKAGKVLPDFARTELDFREIVGEPIDVRRLGVKPFDL